MSTSDIVSVRHVLVEVNMSHTSYSYPGAATPLQTTMAPRGNSLSHTYHTEIAEGARAETPMRCLDDSGDAGAQTGCVALWVGAAPMYARHHGRFVSVQVRVEMISHRCCHINPSSP